MGVEARKRFGPWVNVPLTTADTSIALMSSRVLPIIEDGELDEGSYTAVKITLGDQNYFTASNGIIHTLHAPVELICPHPELTIRKNSLAQYVFFVSAANAIRESPAGSGCFMLDPHSLTSRDVSCAGSISGTVRRKDTEEPMAGVILTAQSAAPGLAKLHVVRTTTTASDGSYTLGFLPTDTDYRILIQSQRGSAADDTNVSNNLHFGRTSSGSLSQDFSIRPPFHSQPGHLIASGFPGLDPASHLSEIIVRQTWQQRGGQRPLDLVIAQCRATGHGPFEFRSLPPGPATITFRYENLLQPMANGTEEQFERHSRRIQIFADHPTYVH